MSILGFLIYLLGLAVCGIAGGMLIGAFGYKVLPLAILLGIYVGGGMAIFRQIAEDLLS